MFDHEKLEKKGRLEVVCGPMFSGKSEELMRRLRRAKIAQQNVLTFKHSLDDRNGTQYIVSHDGKKVDALPIDDIENIFTLVQKTNADVIGIDEIQFFSKDIIAVICDLIEINKRVIVAGLDLDFRGSPFGCVPTLLAIADSITKLQAICIPCGRDAHFTQRLVNGEPAKYNDPTVLIGAQESYQARCRNCYSIDRKYSFSHGKTKNII